MDEGDGAETGHGRVPGSLAAWPGSPSDGSAIWRGWEPALFNQTHDLASGVMTDHVYEDTIRSYEFSSTAGHELIDSGLNTLASKIDMRYYPRFPLSCSIERDSHEPILPRSS